MPNIEYIYKLGSKQILSTEKTNVYLNHTKLVIYNMATGDLYNCIVNLNENKESSPYKGRLLN